MAEIDEKKDYTQINVRVKDAKEFKELAQVLDHYQTRLFKDMLDLYRFENREVIDHARRLHSDD